MKKIIFTLVTTISMLFSSISFASVSQDDTAFLFAENGIALQEMTSNEMAATEGQLFGITMETTTKYLGLAITALKPYATNLFNLLKDKVMTAIQSRLDGFSGGRPVPPVSTDGFGPAV